MFGFSRSSRSFSFVRASTWSLFVALLLSLGSACGTAQQNVHVRREVQDLGGWTRFVPKPLTVAEGIEVSDETREGFDIAFRDALSGRGLLPPAGVSRDVVAVWPRVVAYRLEGGVDRRFVSSEGEAELTVEVRLVDASGKALGVLRAVETNTVHGFLPKVAGPALLGSTADALAEQLEDSLAR